MGKSDISKLPDYLLYGSSKSNVRESKNTTGLVDPVKLFQGSDQCGVSDFSLNEISKKAIIINAINIKRCPDLINELVENGFKIYKYDDNRHMLQDISYPIGIDKQIDILLTDKQKIKKLASKLEKPITSDKLFIIDDFNIDLLRKDLGLTNVDPPKTPKFDIRFVLNSISRIENVLKNIPQETVLYQEDSQGMVYSNLVIDIIKNRFNRSVQKFSSTELDQETTKLMVARSSLQGKGFLSIDSQEDFRKFVNQDNINLDNLRKLLLNNISNLDVNNLSLLPKLTSLIFSNCNLDEVAKYQYTRSLPNIDDLIFDELDIDLSHLHKMLSLCPNTKYVAFYSCDSINFASKNLNIKPYYQIEQISLNEQNLEADSLNNLFSLFPNIKEILLKDCGDVNETIENLNIESLQKIAVLNLQEVSISLSNLAKLVALCPNLEVLILKDSNVIDDGFDIPKNIQFKNLFNIQLDILSAVCADKISTTLTSRSLYKPKINADTIDPYANLSMVRPGMIRGRGASNVVDINIYEDGKDELYEQEHLFTPSSDELPIFDINSYRLEACNKFKYTGGQIVQDLILDDLEDEDDIQKVSMDELEKSFVSVDDYYKCNVKLRVDEQWTALPSLTTQDQLYKICATNLRDKQEVNLNNNFEIKYSYDTGFYYIRTTNDSTQELNIKFLIKAQQNQEPTQNKKLKEIINKYQNFREGTKDDLAKLAHSTDIIQGRFLSS